MSIGAAPEEGRYLHMDGSDQSEIALWDRTAASVVATLSPVLAQVPPDAYRSVMDTHASLAAQQADRVVHLRRKRLKLIEEAEAARIYLPHDSCGGM